MYFIPLVLLAACTQAIANCSMCQWQWTNNTCGACFSVLLEHQSSYQKGGSTIKPHSYNIANLKVIVFETLGAVNPCLDHVQTKVTVTYITSSCSLPGMILRFFMACFYWLSTMSARMLQMHLVWAEKTDTTQHVGQTEHGTFCINSISMPATGPAAKSGPGVLKYIFLWCQVSQTHRPGTCTLEGQVCDQTMANTTIFNHTDTRHTWGSSYYLWECYM